MTIQPIRLLPEVKTDLVAPDWWPVHSLYLPRIGTCSQMWTFLTNKISTTGLFRPSILMTMDSKKI